MAVPTDPRDRLPPFLRRYCPTQEQCRQWSAHGRQAVQRWVGWLWHDSAPRWQRLEWPWKLWSICVLFSVVFLPLFFIHGRSYTEVAIEQPPAAIVDDTPKTVVSDVPPLVTPPDPPSQPQVATASEPSTETAPAPAKHGKKRRRPQPSTAHDETPTPPSPFAARGLPHPATLRSPRGFQLQSHWRPGHRYLLYVVRGWLPERGKMVIFTSCGNDHGPQRQSLPH